MSGLFLTIEGGEGTGKSLFTKGLSHLLEDRKRPFLVTREPGGTPLADQIRGLFLDPPEGDRPIPLTELLLVSAARAQHVSKKIKPALELGLWVVCDRFYDSTRVYQGKLAGVDSALLEAVIHSSVDGCHPALSFILDCPAEISMQRVRSRFLAAGQKVEDANRYDGGNMHMHQSLREGFLELAKIFPARICILDASQSPEEVLAEAVEQLELRGYL